MLDYSVLMCLTVAALKPQRPASLCFGNMCFAAMTHTSLKKTEGNRTQTRPSLWSSFTQNKARLLSSLPVMLCGSVNSSAQVHVMAKVGSLHKEHFSIPCLSNLPSPLS